MAEKSNAMTDGHAVWQRVFHEVSPEFPGIEATHYYIDALAMYMVLDPGQFQVIVTNNLFGDIISETIGNLSAAGRPFSIRHNHRAHRAAEAPSYGLIEQAAARR